VANGTVMVRDASVARNFIAQPTSLRYTTLALLETNEVYEKNAVTSVRPTHCLNHESWA